MTDKKEEALAFFESQIDRFGDEAKAHLDALRDKPKEPEQKYFKGQYGGFWDGDPENKVPGFLHSYDPTERCPYKSTSGLRWRNFTPNNDHPWQPQWIPHTGDECPVDDDQLVWLKFSDGDEGYKSRAGNCKWGQDQEIRITHYALWHVTEWL